MAPTAAHPFTTIEPHEAVVAVPDENLDELWKLVRGDPSAALRMTVPEKIPATVTFIDIAGLVRGAHKGEGLGNQFLAKIREVDAIVHVVRVFEDPNVVHVHPSHPLGTSEQAKEDIEVVNLELELGGIVGKPVIYVANAGEKQLSNVSNISKSQAAVTGEAPVIAVAAKLEEELADLQPLERKQYLKQLGVEYSGLEQLIREAYKILGLITFYTIKGGKEVHAWSIKQGSTALEAAGQVHTDFAEKFVKAEVINVDELLSVGGWKEAHNKGKISLEGRDYKVQDKDVIEFKVGG